jgi:P-type conjugative transfer protein VirB9
MRTRFISLIAALCTLGAISTAHAELIATPLTGDTRLVQFTYDEDNTFLILSKPKAVTHIQFAADEALQSIAAGDTAQWELTPTKNRKNLFIKPKFEGIETSMTVITDKRTYQFVLRSTADGKKWYQRVSWMYSSSLVLEQDVVLDTQEGARQTAPMAPLFAPTKPGPSMVTPSMTVAPSSTASALKPESLRFNYKIEGDAPFKPVKVFDDGKFTYLLMPQDVQEMPALFAVIEGADYSLVNYTIDGGYMVAQRLMDAAVLKLGKTEVRINRTKPSRGFFGFFSGDDTK